MNHNNTYKGNNDFDPNHDVLLDAQGALIMDHHPGGARLRNRILETLFGFDAADNPGQRSIATTLVKEVLGKGGQFGQVVKDNHARSNRRESLCWLTQDQAIEKVQNLFRLCRTRSAPYMPNRSTSNITDGDGDGQANEDISEGSDSFFLANPHDEAAAPAPGNQHSRPPISDNLVHTVATAAEQLSRLSVMENDSVDGAKGELLQRLSMLDSRDGGKSGDSDDDDDDVMVIVDHNLDHPRIGEQVASSFVSILDLVLESCSKETHNEAAASNALLYSEAMQIAFQSLVWTCSRQLPNRAARQVQQVVDITRDKVTVGVPKEIDIVMADGGNDTVGTDDGVDVSLLDGPDYDTFPMIAR